jgi:hypothetical protein
VHTMSLLESIAVEMCWLPMANEWAYLWWHKTWKDKNKLLKFCFSFRFVLFKFCNKKWVIVQVHGFSVLKCQTKKFKNSINYSFFSQMT